MPDPGTSCLEGEVRKFLDDIGTEHVRTYFDRASGFPGSQFDTLGGGGDAVAHRDTFTAEDLVAVTLLEMTVPGDAALAVLHRQASEFNTLLSNIPADVDLRNAPEDVEELQDDRLVNRLKEMRDTAGLHTSVRLLRVLDVAIWMRNRKASTSKLDFTRCRNWS